jgi:multiple sugar transport system permease protein
MTKKNRYLLFALPSFLAIVCVMLFPVGYAIYYSFFNYNLGDKATFTGLLNYIEIFRDPKFLQAVMFSTKFTVVVVIAQFIVGLGIALLMDNIIHWKKPLSILIYLPYFITAAAAGVIFRWMFMAQWGIVSQLCSLVGLTSPNWFDSPIWAQVLVVLAEVWQNTPFAVIILYAGLQSLSMERIEAAKIDGANPWQVFRHVKLANMRHLILLIFMMRIMDSFRLFDRISVMTNGGPAESTQTLAIYNYTISFSMLRIGQGCAVGVLTLIILAIPVFFLMKGMRSAEVD